MATKSTPNTGQLPRTTSYNGETSSNNVKITIFDYNKTIYTEKVTTDVKDCFEPKDKKTIRWINIDGLTHPDIIEEIARNFKLHPLLQEDITSTNQKPKIEEFEDHIFLITKMLNYDALMNELRSEQVSIVLDNDAVVTFQESQGDVFDPIRERIKNNKGLIRGEKQDYLVYSLLNMIVDNYFVVLERIGDRIEEIEDKVVVTPTTETLSDIHSLKVEMLALRKAVWPQRDVISHLERCGHPILTDITRLYLRDVYDHTIQVMDGVETYRDILASIMDIYVSVISNRLNEIMKFLTIVGTIFIPLTFISSLYGMNFRYMPEISHPLGYPLTLLIMAITAGYMIFYIKKKGWL